MTGAVTLAYLHRDESAHSWHHSVTNLLMYDASTKQRVIRGGYLAWSSGIDLERSRNQVVAQFLDNNKAEWLLWVDDDMGFTPDALEQLIAAADAKQRPVVGGLCFGWKDIDGDGLSGMVRRPFTTMFRWNEVEGKAAFSPIVFYPMNTMVPVDATGSAFVLIHRSVFQKIEQEYGRTWYGRIPNPTIPDSTFGEDVSFCIRAKACGFPMFVHTGIRTNHLKRIHVSEAVFWHEVTAPPATDEVDVLVPVMRRPQNAEPFMRSLRASTGLAYVTAIAHEDDVETSAAWRDAGADVILTGSESFACKINEAADVTTAPWLFITGDDVKFRAGWLDHAQHTAKVLGAKVVGANDLGNPRVLAGEHATHMLIERKYVADVGASWDGPGTVCHEGYRHWYVDDEIVTAAKQRGVFTVAPGSIVEHLHPIWGKATEDEVYTLGQSFAKADGVLFRKRVKQHGSH